MQKGDEALPSIILAGRALLVKMHITLELHGIFGSNFVLMYFNIRPATGMKNCDEVSLSIILTGRALLVKMLITLEPDGMFGSNFCILMYFNIVQPLV